MGMHKSGRNDSLFPGASVKTLREYIEQKQAGLIPDKLVIPAKKKLTFEEWWETAGGVDLNHVKQGDKWFGPFIDKATFKLVWEVAQENV